MSPLSSQWKPGLLTAILWIAGCSLLFCGHESAAAAELTLPEIKKQYANSTVFIAVKYQTLSGPDLQTPTAGCKRGSGFIISESGFVATSYHLFTDENHRPFDKIIAVLGKVGESFDCDLPLGDVVTLDQINDTAQVDAALLKIVSTKVYVPVPACSGPVVPDGAPLFVLGFPLGLPLAPQAVTKSNATGKRWQVAGKFDSGASGGPVFSSTGTLVGLVFGGYEKTDISYVVPLSYFASFFPTAGLQLRECPQPLPPRSRVFKDCEYCPEMVVVPAGEFLMGSPADEADRQTNEGPQHKVTLSNAFAVGKYPVTLGEFKTFIGETGHEAVVGCFAWDENARAWNFDSSRSYLSPGFRQVDRHPVVCVNWYDAKAYVQWLSNKTGKEYRLLSEAEREYVTRAGKPTRYWWGNFISAEYANYSGERYLARTEPVYAFVANPFGLFQVHGNVYDWLDDCWHDGYEAAPPDGSAWKKDQCEWRALRGGAWALGADSLRSAARSSGFMANGDWLTGFRVARTIAAEDRK